ncbi:MAG: DUF4160 domain-containing protein [SAR324 cluster bacterium]|nr:DUF4160 domain-containing protein [SAR324 cluster bacterium]MBF0351408.1 DUF4160 domain-containing protein [SAR324 cluster bacterium]
MGTLLTKFGFKFFVYKNDHEPKHVHVMIGDDEFAKIEIRSIKVIYSYLKANDLKRAKKIIKENQNLLERAWDAFFSQREDSKD